MAKINEPTTVVTQRDREVSRQLAQEAAEVATRQMQERTTIAKAKGLLSVLAAIQPNAPGYGPVYTLQRLGQRGKLTAEDIERARRCVNDCVGDPPRPPTVAECLEALSPLASLPRDYLNENKTAVQFAFPDGNGKSVEVTTEQIEAADRLRAAGGL